MNLNCDEFLEFCAQYGDDIACEVLDMISDAQYVGHSTEYVNLTDIYTIDACNHILSGEVRIENASFAFIIESGNNNGTVVIEWGSPESIGVYKPEPPTRYTFIPANPNLQHTSPVKWKAYLYWRETEWFKEKERGYNYDRHFAPGIKTENYYREWAKSKGMIIGTLEDIGLAKEF